MNIYQSRTYRKDLNWPRFDEEPNVLEKQQVLDQQSYRFTFGEKTISNTPKSYDSQSFWKVLDSFVLSAYY